MLFYHIAAVNVGAIAAGGSRRMGRIRISPETIGRGGRQAPLI
jgi:hypothetical protein